MVSTEDPNNRVKIDVFVRAFAPRGAEDVPATIVRRLEKLESEGKIDEYETHVWGRKITAPRSGEEPVCGGWILERIEEFTEWADEHGVCFDPCLVEREVHSEMTGERRTEITLPVVCLALYRGENVVGVVPCRDADGGVQRSVSDCLARLESNRKRLSVGIRS
ncbi:HTH domain-containing protein [Halegenticoccus soli]|uniref:HTH domain-containing protein n=1 Tax=Halegenticoccus soli TaxID=1985678 RepID=UPI000C6DC2AE|nr:HTH domain-containing protein [Halegenticoccus soli]